MAGEALFALPGAVSFASPGFPDWRDEGAYQPLLEVEKAGHAWEWLRRDPTYQSEANSGEFQREGILAADDAAARWGLHRFEDFRLNAIQARPCWRADHHPFVLAAGPGKGKGADAERLGSCLADALIVRAPLTDHILLADGHLSLRIDYAGHWSPGTPLHAAWQLVGLSEAEAALMVLRRLIGISQRGRFVPALHPLNRQARRLVLALRAADALASGASHRDIAAELFGRSAGAPRWRIEASSLRSQAQRLAQGAGALAGGGWRALLKA